MDHVEPTKLCQEFADILDSTPGVINNVCIATRSRTNIHPTVLGREANSFMFVPQAFSFENIDREGRALCLGETVILQEEINPFISELRRRDIKVTAVHNHWLFDSPRLYYMHFESIDPPLSFASKLSRAMEVLTTRNVFGESESCEDCIHEEKWDHSQHRRMKPNPSRLQHLCEDFNDILGGTMHSLENGQCIVMKSRLNIKPTVLGRRGRSFLLIPQMFTFESISRDGRALCSGETVILQEEINPFIRKLQDHGILVTAVHNHWLFDHPRLMFMHWVAIDKPRNFARKVSDALDVLTTSTVRPTRMDK
ncbi:DUF1259 domain-containing protein [Pseudogracilibacillus auburnensis]|uniref:Uncharacterized protein DUF1259 n=1 Tax=Pseudogracilibacillus auburnensis TaxID=1494959 RepID=A0A2V3W5U6_9BACI|nr:DUF1259 domain-containing protein [Pseudogracilibacillus auburnensis]MBO1005239.1 DUF1259 domain-containing protein [Pseudogracilibacillus auburnensis]PXW88564.1 uncharacterized protein DUF1259 [Pseudogracilibacillus auburnensis]